MINRPTILSIGGGGFTHGTDPELDDFCLRLISDKPAIGYLGWANKNDTTRLTRFYARFKDQAGSLSHLPLGVSPDEVTAWVQAKDLIYVAGGNTSDLLAAIRTARALPILKAANNAGCVLAGVSAGGACWFEWILSDSGCEGYQPITGLSLAKGGITPHFNSEPERKSRLELSLRERETGTALAVDDSSCLVTIDGISESYFSTRPNRAAYCLSLEAGCIKYRTLPKFSFS